MLKKLKYQYKVGFILPLSLIVLMFVSACLMFNSTRLLLLTNAITVHKGTLSNLKIEIQVLKYLTKEKQVGSSDSEHIVIDGVDCYIDHEIDVASARCNTTPEIALKLSIIEGKSTVERLFYD